MRRVMLFVVVAVAILLQVSWWPALRLLGVVPDGALVAVVLASLRLRTSEAVIMAAIAGVVLDIASGVNFGLWTGLFMIVALSTGLLIRAGIALDLLVVAPVLVAIGTVLMTIAIWLAMAPAIVGWPVGSMSLRLGLELMLNLGLTVILNPLLGRVQTSPEVEFQVRG